MLYETQNERVEELNDAIYARVIPDAPLEPQYDIRPVSTKYARFPILDRRRVEGVETSLMLYPQQPTPVGVSMGPLSGFSVDQETQLQNRFFALQKHGSGIQSTYIPASTSSLYNDPAFYAPGQPIEAHPGLTPVYDISTMESPIPAFVTSLGMANKPFHNSTSVKGKM